MHGGARRGAERRGLGRGWLLALGLWAGCSRAPVAPAPHEHPEPPARVARAVTEARARPDDYEAQLRAGAALTRQVLEGDPSRFDEAVQRLTRAHQLRPEGRTVPRMLGRLLNLPLAEGDLAYVAQQRTLYQQLVDGGERGPAFTRERFVEQCFLDASRAALAFRRGDPVGAVVRLRALERRMQQHLAAHDDVDVHAMLGNYAQQVAGMVDVGRPRRTALAVEHLEHVVQRYEELSPEARGVEYDVPGVRAVFTHWLAELSLAQGRIARAHELYAEVERLGEEPGATAAMHTLAAVASQRRALPHPPSREELLPLWPAGYDSCIACHAHEAVPRMERPSTSAREHATVADPRRARRWAQR